MTSGDTIAALGSAVGPCGRIIIRASGPMALTLAARLTRCDSLDAGASRRRLSFSGLAVPAWLYVFRAPRSYTGEDVVEFHLPGSPVAAKMLLDHLLHTPGVRSAEPGEFTARAYFNGRIGLTEAEGVAAAVTAHSERELSAARRLLAGELADRLRPALDRIAETLALVEAGIDFADEGVTFLPADDLSRRVEALDAALGALLADSVRFERLTHEPRVVLAGRPNAGKSILLNALCGRPRAVVAPVAGTTRDVLTAEAALTRGLVRLTDAAGLEDDAAGGPVADDSPQGRVARRMRDNALRAAESADVLVLVRDCTDGRPPLRLPRDPDLLVLSKIDLLPAPPAAAAPPSVAVSAATGTNLERLRECLDRLAFGPASGGPSTALALNARHVRCVEDARAALSRCAGRVADGDGPELIALELREALDAVGGVLGRVSPDDLLGRIFSTFCIGK